MLNEKQQFNSPEKLTKFSERYKVIIDNLNTSKDRELLEPLRKLNDDVEKFDARDIIQNKMNSLNRKLTDDEINEYEYLMGSYLSNAKEWVHFANNCIQKIQSKTSEDDVSELWEKITKYIKLAIEDLKKLNL